jgi:hypothetical protein
MNADGSHQHRLTHFRGGDGVEAWFLDGRVILTHFHEDVQEIADPLNTKPKHIASRTLTGSLEWQNSSVLPGALPEAVASLKEEGGGDLLVMVPR